MKNKKAIMVSEILDKKPEYKFKLPNDAPEKTVGRYQPQLNWKDFSHEHIIYIDVKRIIIYCIELNKYGWDMSFEQVFSHVASHEYLHYLLSQISRKANEDFDNLFGTIGNDPKFVYSGITFEGDLPYLYILSKRHFITKLLYTMKNKVEVIRKWHNVQTVLKNPTAFTKTKQKIMELKLWFVSIIRKVNKT